MSQQAFSDFRAMANSNPAIAQACIEAVKAGGQRAVINVGRKHGFEFTEDEAVDAISHSELSDAELELVAGGIPNSGYGSGGTGGGDGK